MSHIRPFAHRGPVPSPMPVSTYSKVVPRLLGWLYGAASKRQHSKAELAAQLGVTYSYLQQLGSGRHPVENVSADFCRSCARYLDIPAVVVMLAAGRITIADFLLPEAAYTPVNQLAEGLARIAADPMVGSLMPPEVWTVPDSVKALLIALYEDATQQELFPPRQLPALLQGLQDAALIMDDMHVRLPVANAGWNPSGGGQ